MVGSEFQNIISPEGIQENVPLAPYTTFRAGGPARFFVTPQNEAEFAALVRFLEERHEKCFVLGRGSNLLVSDKGFEGTVIYTRKMLNRIVKTGDGQGFSAQCGVLLQDLSAQGFTGWSSRTGFPEQSAARCS